MLTYILTRQQFSDVFDFLLCFVGRHRRSIRSFDCGLTGIGDIITIFLLRVQVHLDCVRDFLRQRLLLEQAGKFVLFQLLEPGMLNQLGR